MVIYGLAILSLCFFLGIFVGDVLGVILGINSNVGGVGFAMLLLILVSEYLMKNNKLSAKAQEGILFWSAMYIPVVVAMTATQNVVAAVKGGPVAILAGIIAVVVAFVLVPVLSKLGGKPSINDGASVNK
ncbi:MAG: malonate transporter subunit MadL [Bacillota bacterium]